MKTEFEKLDEMLENTPAGICVVSVDCDFPVMQANNTFFELFGYTKDEAASVGYNNLFYPLDRIFKEKLRALQSELRETDSPVTGEIELSVNAADGHKVDILARYHYFGREDGRIIANVIDITKQKRLVDEIRISEERYRLALMQSGKYFASFSVSTRTLHISKELCDRFELTADIDNMPFNPIVERLIEPGSIQTHRRLFELIIAGEAAGAAIVSCHMPQAPDAALWFCMSFNSVFDAQGLPVSSIIAFEDISQQRQAELEAKWTQLNLVALPDREYVVGEYNLTTGKLLSQTGGLFMHTPGFMTTYDDVTAFGLEHFIYSDDVPIYRDFLNRQRLLALYSSGVSEDSVEYRAFQSGSTPRWTQTSVHMITDPYSGDVMIQLLHRDIDKRKSDELALRLDIEKMKNELENSRIKVMISQMQPHFLYNALSAIQTIVKTDPDYAYQLIYDFTVHLRSSIKALSSDALIPFKDELKNVQAYLNIERMRFGDELQVVYDIACDDFSVIPLSIQPLAENAARHGVFKKGEDGGTVTVRAYNTDTSYVVEVEDDGVGFDVDAALKEHSDSVGLKSLIYRLKNLQNASVSIESRIGFGTKVTVNFPKSEGSAQGL